MDRGAWWAVAGGVAESRTQLSDSHLHFGLLSLLLPEASHCLSPGIISTEFRFLKLKPKKEDVFRQILVLPCDLHPLAKGICRNDFLELEGKNLGTKRNGTSRSFAASRLCIQAGGLELLTEASQPWALLPDSAFSDCTLGSWTIQGMLNISQLISGQQPWLTAAGIGEAGRESG